MRRAARGIGLASALSLICVVVACTGPAVGPTAPIDSSSTISPTQGETGRDLTVEAGAFSVTYRLDGAVIDSRRVGVEVPIGMVFQSTNSGRVAAGAVVGRLSTESRNAAMLASTRGTVAASRLAMLREHIGEVRAPVAGRLLLGEKPGIARDGLDVVATLSPVQTLRYQGIRFSGAADVETVVGQRRVPCRAIWLTEGGGSRGGSRVHCRLPDNVETVAGIPAVMTLSAPEVTGAIVVPHIYVGLDSSGSNYIVRKVEGDSVVERPVVVSVTDGVRRVIRSGVEVGDVLQVVEP